MGDYDLLEDEDLTALGAFELNQIYTGDARELAKGIPDKCAALAFADPPYWVGYDYGNKTDREMDYIDPVWLANELQRVSICALVTPGNGNQRLYPPERWQIAWNKPASTGHNKIGGWAIWEPILVYGNPKKAIYQDSVIARGGNEFDADFHKCPKPLSLMVWLIENFTDVNDIVIDFTCGSGTTCKAAKMLGRNYIAFEIDPQTAERARERVRNTQPPLFVLQPEQIAMEF